MDTKSKNIKRVNFFAGFVSWLCMILLIYAVSLIVAGLLILIFTPELGGDLTKWGNYFLDNGELPDEISLRTSSAALLVILDFLLVFFLKRHRKQFEIGLASMLSKTWVELKLIIIAAVLFLSYETGEPLLILFSVMVMLYIICLDIGYNRHFFKCNAVKSLMKTISAKDIENSYAIKAQKRFVFCVIVVILIVVFAVLALMLLTYIGTNLYQNTLFFSLAPAAIILFSVGGVIASISWYMINLKKDLNDLSLIMVQVEEMYGGNLNAVNIIPPNSNFFDLAMQLNMIRTGIEKAVDEGIKADMTKVELITNVSHDIKTPLTSVITYIDLLKKEPGLPEHVQDYIKTLSNKADRLSDIVQDVFEVSKAATGNIALYPENIDLSKLLQQTLAEMDEMISNSTISWRTDLPETPVMINVDGQKIYRVYQNLIKNATQYALEGSRAYITLRQLDDIAEVSIRNVSREEFKTTEAEYLTGRFIRGDKNRTTEGSGLGLSIAKSFTEACGGKFILHTDGDIFLAVTQFPTIQSASVFSEVTENVNETI